MVEVFSLRYINMGKLGFWILLAVLALVKGQQCLPWGLRLYLGDTYMNSSGTNDLRIAFNTDDSCSDSFLELNGKPVDCENQNTTIVPINYTIHTHTCTLNLTFNSDVYRGSYVAVGLTLDKVEARRESISFRVPRRNTKSEFKTLLLGDWGILDDKTKETVSDILPHIAKLVDDQNLLLGIFMGDLGYDLCDQQVKTNISCKKYKPVLQMAELITSRVALMPILGNHQYAPNHQLSKQLISQTYMTPFGDLNMYSFQVGDIRFQIFNPYEQIFLGDTSQEASKIQWLKQDNSKKSSGIEWVIPSSHYPFYCKTYLNNTECAQSTYSQTMSKFLDYFYEYGVALNFGAHIHMYRRTKPLDRHAGFNDPIPETLQSNFVYKGDNNRVVFVVEGAAGNSDFVELQGFPLADYEESQVPNAGYSVLIAYPGQRKLESSHYYGANGTVADSFVIDHSTPAWRLALVVGIGALVFLLVSALMLRLAIKHRTVRSPTLLQPSIPSLSQDY